MAQRLPGGAAFHYRRCDHSDEIAGLGSRLVMQSTRMMPSSSLSPRSCSRRTMRPVSPWTTGWHQGCSSNDSSADRSSRTRPER